MEEKNEKKLNDVRKRVMSITTRNFTISGCPEDVFQRFSKYAKENAADGYWMAIKQLLDIAETNAKELMLFERLEELSDRMNELENKGEPKQKTIKRFGLQEEKKDE
jgi:hypothetical protein